MTANLLEDPIDWPGLIKDPIQCAVIHLSWWMPLDASAGRCNIFDVALMICDGNPFSLRPELQSIVREELVAEALYGSRLAHEALCNAAMVLIKEGSSLPPWLGRYLVIVAAEGKKASSKKGPKRQPNSVRDMAIWYVVGLIAKCYRLDHTRNVATTEKESACSIVAKARERLKVDLLEASVNTIWGSCAGRMSLARMEATTAAHRMRTACASIARCVGDREWLKKHDTRELARSWRRAESARCSPHAQSRRKKKVHAPAC